ncbi:MAG: hypothetical protein KatS3mg105_3680 [Gemmatales bacterium]|nr:MAG: hypothetical protein KatS3mg105_3680 [Gemmatales bacterium]
MLNPLGGLHHICTTNNDLSRALAAPLLAQLSKDLGNLYPVTDVAQVEFSAAEAQGTDLTSAIQSYYKKAQPLFYSKNEAKESAFLLMPASDAVKCSAMPPNKQYLPSSWCWCLVNPI